jgi:PKD repeat protein
MTNCLILLIGGLMLVLIAGIGTPVAATVLNVPAAVFTDSPLSGPAPLAVQFTDGSTNTPTSWNWAFGDGGTSSLQNPSHTYSTAGTYTASLTATNAAGSSSAYTQTITVSAATTSVTTSLPPVASFTVTWAAAENTAPLAVQFTDGSTNSPTSWNWTFGDGGTSPLQDPSYTYTTAGTYTASLIATNAAGSSSAYTQTITVNAAATTSVPVVTAVSPAYGPVSTSTAITITGTGFTGATAVTVGGTAVTNLVVVSATEITATTPASSTVGQVDVLVTTPSGTSTSVAGDKYTFAATATTIPLPIFSASPTSGSAPLSVTFTDASTGSPASWSWSFGDGNTSTLENPTNTYVNNGTYSVTLTETNSIGTNVTTMTGYIVVGAAAPVVGFTADPLDGTAPLMVQFTDSSTNTPTSWAWDFGDGGSSSIQDPVHTYTTTGTYTVTLKAANAEGSNVATETNFITVTGAQAQTVTQATPIPTPLAPTFAITAAETTDSSTADWLAKQNAVVATTTKKSPGYDMFSALIGCGVIAGIAVYRKR